MSRRTRMSLAAVPLGLALWGCASTGTADGPRADRNLINEEELEEFRQWSAYEAIRQLRPAWLMSRGAVNFQGEGGTLPRVAVDGIPHGEIDSLRDISVQDIRDMRFLSPSDATTHYGTGYPAGIIEVRTKGPGGPEIIQDRAFRPVAPALG